jgi:predicted DsbA family dithiol-disulfide isomerase
MDKEKYREGIEVDIVDALKAGLSGTPFFVVGRVVGDHVEGLKFVGAVSYVEIEEKLAELLAAANQDYH